MEPLIGALAILTRHAKLSASGRFRNTGSALMSCNGGFYFCHSIPVRATHPGGSAADFPASLYPRCLMSAATA